VDFWTIFSSFKDLEGSSLTEKLSMSVVLWFMIRRELKKGDSETKAKLLKLELSIKEIRVHVGLDKTEE